MQHTLDTLSDALDAFTAHEGLPRTMCADEMLIDCTLTPAQRDWLGTFVRLWEITESLESVSDAARSNGLRWR